MYMGEISKRKGGFDLLKAIVDNKEYFADKLLLRMGGNEVDGDIKAYIRENGLESFITYEGWIAGQKKIDCLNWEDVYICHPTMRDCLLLSLKQCPIVILSYLLL